MAKRYFAQQANTIKHDIDFGGRNGSEKLNGIRAIWDGGITRGVPKADIPWANVSSDEHYVEPVIATGLWSRYGNVIHASEEFLDSLPKLPLDGELYIGYNTRQELIRIVMPLIPDSVKWSRVQYKCYDVPSYSAWLADGYVEDADRRFSNCMEFVEDRKHLLDVYIKVPIRHMDAINLIGETGLLHEQRKLSHIPSIAKEQVLKWYGSLPSGAEGIMLREPQSFWTPVRTNNLLKYKPTADMEVEIVGYNTGKKTEKGSRLLGMIGSLICRLPNGKLRSVSGLNTQLRELESEGEKWALENPGQELPAEFEAIHFQRGEIHTITYRGLTEDGIPEEARYGWKYEHM